MSFAIIGSGNIGTAIARQFARKAINDAIANARGPGSLGPLGEELGAHLVPQILEAALKADVVILAVLFSAVPAVARAGDWANKIVIDATNAFSFLGMMQRPTPKSRNWRRFWDLRRSRWARSRKADFCSSMAVRW
jgi:predicted dinucleotide-binding enzyme